MPTFSVEYSTVLTMPPDLARAGLQVNGCKNTEYRQYIVASFSDRFFV